MQFRGLDAQAARTFCERWLPAWSGNRPVGATTVEVDGVCTVQLRGGLIYRNMVYFDRSELLGALAGKSPL